jgi:hypothetical protein
MISISTIDQNASGVIVIAEDPASSLEDSEARITRTDTLDGGTVVDHRGFFDGDRTFEIEANLSESDTAALKALFEDQTFLNMSCRLGVFEVAIRRLRADGGQIQMTILIKEKKSE